MYKRAGVFAVYISAGVLTACGGATSSPSTVTVSASSSTVAASPTTSADAAASIKIPDVVGQNAEIVRKKLAELGLTNVTFGSADPKHSFEGNAAKWTVVSIEPASGTVVNTGDPIVVKATKEQ